MRTKTSYGPGSGTRRSEYSIASGPPNERMSAAFIGFGIDSGFGLSVSIMMPMMDTRNPTATLAP
ncbi:hypothetical protein CQ018_17810 [Arthrobacter sp. MYb227]|uniref:hypothetical protein n=1 Tax=Arthrobacter sp. MYb227 TaxID=1848601 RepID=UPI000CFB4110|nr:hypothetical protein [Arthrobacter sp. MYb227]PQZ87317.1 hypothetical protein CQ018_17810 [Arthrobacter sp. MYb227]